MARTLLRSLGFAVTLAATGCVRVVAGGTVTPVLPSDPVFDHLKRIALHEAAAFERTGQYIGTPGLPVELRNMGDMTVLVLLGATQTPDYVIAIRNRDASKVCRYHGGKGGDGKVLCIDEKGESKTWPLFADGSHP